LYNIITMKKSFLFGVFCFLMAVIAIINLAESSMAAPPAQLTSFPTPTPGADGRIVYIVKSGDSLWRISAVAGIPIEEIRALNNLGSAEIITPGQEILLGLGGPAAEAPTQGPPPTPTSELPTPTPGIGTGTICVLLFEDINGDSIRQEDEPSLAGGAISVNDRFGDISLTADTPSGGISENLFPELEELGFTCFESLEKGEYNLTIASPDGYNATTPLSYLSNLNPGDELLFDFGAQPNSETLARAPIPVGTGKSPILGIFGFLLLVLGIGLGVYTLIFRRT
jgi:hypothetical protein